MCGIGLLVTNKSDPNDDMNDIPSSDTPVFNDIISSIARRGPNFSSSHSISIDNKNQSNIQVCASVLHIQGEIMTTQPVIDVDRNILLWNGQVFGGIKIPQNQSDTITISYQLQSILMNENSQPLTDYKEVANKITYFLTQIQGPFAIIYFHKYSSSIHYARDSFGRRSLLRIQSPISTYSSISNLITTSAPTSASTSASVDLSTHTSTSSPSASISSIDCLKSSSSTKINTDGNKRQLVMGLCSVKPKGDHSFIWEEVPTDGIYSISLSDVNTIGSNNTTNNIYEHFITCWPAQRVRLSRLKYSQSDTSNTNSSSNTNISSTSCSNSDMYRSNGSIGFEESSKKFLQVLTQAMHRRISALYKDPNSTITNTTNTARSTMTTTICDNVNASDDSDVSDSISRNIQQCSDVGVLFSGGIDSVLLTAILHHSLSLQPFMAIELINISFFNDYESQSLEPSPDRLAAIVALAELQVR